MLGKLEMHLLTIFYIPCIFNGFMRAYKYVKISFVIIKVYVSEWVIFSYLVNLPFSILLIGIPIHLTVSILFCKFSHLHWVFFSPVFKIFDHSY